MCGILSLLSPKRHGYPQFSFGIPRVRIKIYILWIVLNSAKIPLYYALVICFPHPPTPGDSGDIWGNY